MTTLTTEQTVAMMYDHIEGQTGERLHTHPYGVFGDMVEPDSLELPPPQAWKDITLRQETQREKQDGDTQEQGNKHNSDQHGVVQAESCVLDTNPEQQDVYEVEDVGQGHDGRVIS